MHGVFPIIFTIYLWDVWACKGGVRRWIAIIFKN